VREQIETKVAAFKAHQSQAPLLPVYERALRSPSEFYHLAACVEPGDTERETDLFEGIAEE